MQHKLHLTLKSALSEQKVTVDLYGCKKCGFVFNADFDVKKTEYSLSYENTQDNSEYFYLYLVRLAERLYKKYRLVDKKIVEVGCGKGHFMKIIYDLGAKDIKGFDPSYVNYDSFIDRLVIKKFLKQENIKEKADFIICRHVLEHVLDPNNFILSVAKCLADDGVIYFEFPDLEWIVEHEVFFDFFYEHCNYFTKKSVSFLFSKFGFNNIVLNHGLMGQYFQLEISRGVSKDSRSCKSTDFDRITKFIDKKSAEYKKMVSVFGRFLIWGAGAKGVTFLNRLNITPSQCSYVVDINLNKQNKFIPITGQKIVSPEILKKEKINNIIIMNPVYEKEIKIIAAKYNYKGKFTLL